MGQDKTRQNKLFTCYSSETHMRTSRRPFLPIDEYCCHYFCQYWEGEGYKTPDKTREEVKRKPDRTRNAKTKQACKKRQGRTRQEKTREARQDKTGQGKAHDSQGQADAKMPSQDRTWIDRQAATQNRISTSTMKTLKDKDRQDK